jgi:hypothetical protein
MGFSMTGPKWRQALIDAGHTIVCWECETPILKGDERKHIHNGRWMGERLRMRKIPYAIIDREYVTLEEFKKRTGWNTGGQVGLVLEKRP